MVSTATGAGSLVIKGTLDTSMIEQGFSRVKQGFSSVGGFAASFNSDLVRMGQASAKLAKGLFNVGAAGSAALITLASKAPAVAPAMAKIGVAFDKIIRNLGEGMAPAFEKVASWLDKFATWSGAHPDIFANVVIALSAIAALKFVGALGFIKALGGLLVSPSVLIALAALATIASAVAIGGGLVEQFKVGKGTAVPIPEAAKRQIQNAGTVEFLDLVNRYADRIGGDLGPERTARIDPETGELYSSRHLERDILRHANYSYISQMNAEEDRRFFLLSWWDALWG